MGPLPDCRDHTPPRTRHCNQSVCWLRYVKNIPHDTLRHEKMAVDVTQTLDCDGALKEFPLEGKRVRVKHEEVTGVSAH